MDFQNALADLDVKEDILSVAINAEERTIETLFAGLRCAQNFLQKL